MNAIIEIAEAKEAEIMALKEYEHLFPNTYFEEVGDPEYLIETI